MEIHSIRFALDGDEGGTLSLHRNEDGSYSFSVTYDAGFSIPTGHSLRVRLAGLPSGSAFAEDAGSGGYAYGVYDAYVGSGQNGLYVDVDLDALASVSASLPAAVGTAAPLQVAIRLERDGSEVGSGAVLATETVDVGAASAGQEDGQAGAPAAADASSSVHFNVGWSIDTLNDDASGSVVIQPSGASAGISVQAIGGVDPANVLIQAARFSYAQDGVRSTNIDRVEGSKLGGNLLATFDSTSSSKVDFIVRNAGVGVIDSATGTRGSATIGINNAVTVAESPGLGHSLRLIVHADGVAALDPSVQSVAGRVNNLVGNKGAEVFLDARGDLTIDGGAGQAVIAGDVRTAFGEVYLQGGSDVIIASAASSVFGDVESASGRVPGGTEILDLRISGGDDTIIAGSTGPGGGRIFGDAGSVRDAEYFNGGNDSIVAEGSGVVISGDASAIYGGGFSGDDDYIRANGGGNLYGDAQSIRDAGEASAGSDVIIGRGQLIGDIGEVSGAVELSGGNDSLQASGDDVGGVRIYGDFNSATDGANVIGGDDAVSGSGGDDFLTGDGVVAAAGASVVGGDDFLQGGGGQDTLYGDVLYSDDSSRVVGGRDVLHGGAGDDVVYGQGGADVLEGGAGDDVLYGDSETASSDDGADSVQGGVGADTVFGGGGDDVLYGDSETASSSDGGDYIQGGAGADAVFGGGGSDHLLGDYGHIELSGESVQGENDTLSGAEGVDCAFGDAHDLTGQGTLYGGNDTINAGQGEFAATATEGTEVIFGDAGGVSGAIQVVGGDDVLVNEGGGIAMYGDTGAVSANATVTGGNDNLQGASSAEVILGDTGDVSGTAVVMGGDDTISSSGGWDGLVGDSLTVSGNATVIGGADVIENGKAEQSFFYGDVWIVRDSGVIIGNDDQITGGEALNWVYGDARIVEDNASVVGGDDVFFGQDQGNRGFGDSDDMSGNGRLIGGDDFLSGGAGSDQFVGDVWRASDGGQVIGGNDTILGGGGADWIFGETVRAFNSRVAGDAVIGGDDSLRGDDGNDLLAGDVFDNSVGNGFSTISGGDDAVNGGRGSDDLAGDVYYAGGSGQLVVGGDDVLQGGGVDAAGVDVIAGDTREIFGSATLRGGNDHISQQQGTLIGQGDATTAYDSSWIIGGNDTLIGGSSDDQLVGDVQRVNSGSVHAGDDVLHGGAGDDVLIGDVGVMGAGGEYLAGSDTLSGGTGADSLYGDDRFGRLQGGDDTYLFQSDSGIDNILDSGGDDRIVFEDASWDELWFSRAGSNLLIRQLGTDSSVEVSDWYSSSQRKIETIGADSGGSTLGADRVDALVTAMAGVAIPGAGGISSASIGGGALGGNLLSVLDASWQKTS